MKYLIGNDRDHSLYRILNDPEVKALPSNYQIIKEICEKRKKEKVGEEKSLSDISDSHLPKWDPKQYEKNYI